VTSASVYQQTSTCTFSHDDRSARGKDPLTGAPRPTGECHEVGTLTCATIPLPSSMPARGPTIRRDADCAAPILLLYAEEYGEVEYCGLPVKPSYLGEHRFGLTGRGHLLRSDVPGSLRAHALMQTANAHWQC
jgi:hypothetical protein